MKGVRATSWISDLVPGDGDPRHGLNGYGNLGCRCEICRGAQATYMRALRARNKARPVPDGVEHGKDSTYCNYRCKCQPCRDAHAEAGRNRRSA